MLVVIPFCRKDEALCIKNLELCKLLDGHYDFECLISTDSEVSLDHVESAATALFSKVHVVKYDHWSGDRDWPVTENWAWQQTARHVHSKFHAFGSWLWWEPDATPVSQGWIKTLWEAHRNGGKLFSGHVVKGEGYMNGVAIYPVNIAAISPNAMIIRKQPFDKVLREGASRHYNPINHLIQFVWDEGGRPPTFRDQRSVKKSITPSTVLFHRCKDGSLADRMMEMMDPTRLVSSNPNAPSHLSFKHSGPFGDLIYTCGVIKAKGGGSLCVGNSDGPRVKMNRDLYDVIAPLLEIQPYLSSVEFDPNARCDYDLDIFRPILREDNYQFGRTIMSCIAQAAEVECPPDTEPWLHVDHSVVVDGKPIVVNRTVRYRNHRFPWGKIAEKYREKCIFLGSESEHELMKMQFSWPELKRFPTRTMLDAARVIAGCQMFIGNQSSLYAVAEGLKKPAILEIFLYHADVLYHRAEVSHGWDSNVFLPDI